MWSELVELLQRELDADTAGRIEKTIRMELAGQRISVPAKVDCATLTPDAIRKALARNSYSVDKAAAELGVHPSTIYHRLQRKLPKKQSREEPGTFLGRVLR